VKEDRQAYREIASPQGRTTGYVTPPGAPTIVERKLDHTTIWRMLGWLGSQVAALLVGIPPIPHGNQQPTLHPLPGTVAPHKSRSRERELVLCQSHQLLQLMAKRENPTPKKLFPRFATRSGFG
jgi:hypothetical protein